MSTIKFSPTEETSIILNGKFNGDSLSKNLKLSLNKSLALETKLPNEIKFMSGMSGKKYRYLINNFISIAENPKYLEIGCWAGSTVCSAIYGNKVKALWLFSSHLQKIKSNFNFFWWARQDSNLGPIHYECTALTN